MGFPAAAVINAVENCKKWGRPEGEWRAGKPANTIATMSQPPYGQVPPGPAPWPPAAPPAAAPARNGSRALGIAGVVLGLVGLIAGVSAWLRPIPKPEAAPVYSEQQVADAKKAVCEAYSQFNRALVATSNRDGGDDATARLVVAVNIRLALYAGSDYLLQALATKPAATPRLSNSIKEIAATYQEMAIKQLGEVPNSDIDPLVERAKSVSQEIDETCR